MDDDVTGQEPFTNERHRTTFSFLWSQEQARYVSFRKLIIGFPGVTCFQIFIQSALILTEKNMSVQIPMNVIALTLEENSAQGLQTYVWVNH